MMIREVTPLANSDEIKKVFLCGKVFSAAAPINTMQLFKGRKEQLQSVISAVTARGKHIVLFGDRGVGKTSLANILKDAMATIGSIEVVKVNCNESDNYLDLWRRILTNISVIAETPDDSEQLVNVEYSLDQWLETYPKVGSGEIKRILNVKCNESHELVLIFDEFDRLSKECRAKFADTIKDLSDSSTNATITLIGVATNLTELIG